jgi:hypothetical protein
MLITKQFVMINLPKTGSTFARKVLKRIHDPKGGREFLERIGLLNSALEELLMPQKFFTEIHTASNPVVEQHGAYVQIPAEHKDKLVMSVIRDPVERLVSMYEFRAWVRNPFPDMVQLKKRFPAFPDLSFEEFLDMMFEFVHLMHPPGMKVRVGPLTTQFVRFYAKDPLKTILSLREDTDLARDQDLHFPKITFLHTENLNQELYDFLKGLGYSEQKISFIGTMDKENTTGRSRPSYMTAADVTRIYQSVRFFYQLFPEYKRNDTQ